MYTLRGSRADEDFLFDVFVHNLSKKSDFKYTKRTFDIALWLHLIDHIIVTVNLRIGDLISLASKAVCLNEGSKCELVRGSWLWHCRVF